MSEQLIIAECEFGGNLHVVPGWKGSLDNEKLHDLLERCLRTRDELLWTEFIRRAQPVIAGVVIKTVRRWTRPTSALVDDLIQETYLKLFANNARALRRFVCHHENALYGFLKVVTSNVVQDHFRNSYSQKRGHGREDERIDQLNEGGKLNGIANTDGTSLYGFTCRAFNESASRHDGMERNILLQQIDSYLKRRTSGPTFSRDYTIFWLYYREGLTAKAIASCAGIGLTVKGVESTLLRLTRLVCQQFGTTS